MIYRDPEMHNKWWYAPVVAVMVFAALAFASEKDYQAAEREARVYCEMVEQGAWPDFKRLRENGECDE